MLQSAATIVEICKNHLCFHADEYIVVGSGCLSIHGIREARDIDLVVTEKLYNKCKAEKDWVERWHEMGRRNVLHKTVLGMEVELYLEINCDSACFNFEELHSQSLMFFGIRFIRPSQMLFLKQSYPEPTKSAQKTVKDISLFETLIHNQYPKSVTFGDTQ